MEGIPQIPMISFKLKESTENPDFKNIKSYIQENYGESSNAYDKEFSELNQLRNNVIAAPHDTTGLSLLKRYFAQLQLLKGRFPMEEGEKAAISFTWEDLYLKVPITVADVRLEEAAILYNIGALHSILGSKSARTDSEGMKVVCTHFQCAAWAFQQVHQRYCVLQAPDLDKDLLKLAENIMLAQAQECILEKSIVDSRNPSIISKVSQQLVEYYKQNLYYLDSENISYVVSGKVYRDWKARCSLKMLYSHAICFYYMGVSAEQASKYGEMVAWYEAAEKKLTESEKFMKDLKSKGFCETMHFARDVMQGKYESAKKDNDFIYHDKIPDVNTLAEPKGATLVKGISFNAQDPEIYGADIFQNLVPMETHEAASIYSEEKARLLREIDAEREVKNDELINTMISLQLDQESFSLIDPPIPQSLMDCCAKLGAKPDVEKELVDKMKGLSCICLDVKSTLDNLKEQIDKEEEEVASFQKSINRSLASWRGVSDIKRDYAEYMTAYEAAYLSNQKLREALDQHLPNIRMLCRPLQEIKERLPSVTSMKDDDTEKEIAEAKRLLDKVNEMERQRDTLYNQLRESIHNDDITKTLLSNKVADDRKSQSDLFAESLQKHDSFRNILNQNFAAQANILQALVDMNATLAPKKLAIADTKLARHEEIAKLEISFESYQDLLSKCEEGYKFYETLLQKSHEICHKFTKIQQACTKERNDFINSQQQPQNIPQVSTPQVAPNSMNISTSLPPQPLMSTLPNVGGPGSSTAPPGNMPLTLGEVMRARAAAKMSADPSQGKKDSSQEAPKTENRANAPGMPQAASQYSNNVPSFPSSSMAGPTYNPPSSQRPPEQTGGLNVSQQNYVSGQGGNYNPPVSQTHGFSSIPSSRPYTHTPPSTNPGQPLSNPMGHQVQPHQQFPNITNQQNYPGMQPHHNPSSPNQFQPGKCSYGMPTAGNVQSANQFSGPTHTSQKPSGNPSVPYQSQSMTTPANQAGLNQYGQIHSQHIPSNSIPTNQFSQNGEFQAQKMQNMTQNFQGMNTPAVSQGHFAQTAPNNFPVQPRITSQANQTLMGKIQPTGQNSSIPHQQYQTSQFQQQFQSSFSQPGLQQFPVSGQFLPGQSPSASLPGQSHQRMMQPAGQTQPGQFQQGLAQPGNYQQGQAQPGHYQQGQAQPANYQQGQAQPGNYQQGQAQPANYQQGQAQPGNYQQGQAQPGNYQQGQAQPGNYQQGQAQPGNYQQAQAQPGNYQQGQAQPANYQQGQAQPGNYQQGQAQPGNYQQGQAQPGNYQQGQVQPGNYQQGQAQPGNYQQGQAQQPVQHQRGQTPPGQFQQGQTQQPGQPAVQHQQAKAQPGQFQHGQTQQPAAVRHPQAKTPLGHFQHGQAQQPGQPTVLHQQAKTQPGQYQQGQAQQAVQHQQGQIPPGQPTVLHQQGQTQPGHFHQGQTQPGHFHQGQTQPGHFQQGQTQPGHFQQGQTQPGHFQQGQTQPGHFQQGQTPPGQFQTFGTQNLADTSRNDRSPRKSSKSAQPLHVTSSTAKNQNSCQIPPDRPFSPNQSQNGAGISKDKSNNVPFLSSDTVALGIPFMKKLSGGVISCETKDPTESQSSSQANLDTSKTILNPENFGPAQNYGILPEYMVQPPSEMEANSLSVQQQGCSNFYESDPQMNNNFVSASSDNRNIQRMYSHKNESTTSDFSSPDAHRPDCLKTSSDLLSSSPLDKSLCEESHNQVLTPRVLTREDIEEQRAEEKLRELQASHPHPLNDNLTLNRFIADVERYLKRLEDLERSDSRELLNMWKQLLDKDKESGKRSIAIARCYTLKNRNQDHLPYDSTRVCLKESKDDYINASFIEYPCENAALPRFLACQAPLNITLNDFWTMIFEQGCEIVVCLVKSSPDNTGKSKIVDHWPTVKGESKQFGHLEVCLQAQKEKEEWTERIIVVKHRSTHQTRTIVHFNYHQMSPKLPTSVESFTSFINEIHLFYRQQRNPIKPIAVICSSGCGRTGLFITCSVLVHLMEQTGILPELLEVVAHLWKQRGSLIQDREQLAFAGCFLAHYAGDMLVKRDIIVGRGRRISNPSTPALSQVPPTQCGINSASLADNLFSNQTLQTNDLYSHVEKWTVKPGSRTESPARQTTTPSNKDSTTTNVDQNGTTSSSMNQSDSKQETVDKRQKAQSTILSDLPANLVGFNDPSQLNLSPVPEEKRRPSKKDFSEPNRGKEALRQATLSRSTKDDPFHDLDPLWSLNK